MVDIETNMAAEAPNGVNGVDGVKRKQPLDMEAIIRQEREEEAARARPRFIKKAERERLKAEKQRKIEEERAARRAAVQRFEDMPRTTKEVKMEDPDEPALKTITAYTNNAPHSILPATEEELGRKLTPAEIESAQIRQRYMGIEYTASTFSAKKKRRRTTDKKFNFDWNPEDDTSVTYNPVYEGRNETSFYGRGRLGGFDEAAAEASTQAYAKALIERDPIDGQRRANELLAMERKRKETNHRHALEKHWSEKPLDQMRERDWRIFKEDFNISMKGGHLPNPMRNWGESGLPTKLLKIIEDIGYDEPSAVQRACIPIALQSRDLIGVAVTGSGKTAAFLLPLLVYISDLPALDSTTKADGPYAIILAPTRELAQQIETEAKRFAEPLGFNCVSLIGGHSIEEQSFALRDGAEIIIATPGRLVDCIERRVLVLNQCCYVIMDEADKMIDMGFEEPVNKILDALPVSNEKPDTEEAEDSKAMAKHVGRDKRYRQTMMYTATMPPAIERIAKKYLRRPAIVNIGNAGEAVETVEQRVEYVPGEDKRKMRLREVLSSGEFQPPVIVFVNIKRMVDTVANEIRKWGFRSVAIHGSKTQDQREAAINQLRNGTAEVMVATDVAGRGIDVPNVSLVVNFNMANNIENYTHRIGRTGRAGKSGVALTFWDNQDSEVLYDLRQMLQKSSISKVPEDLKKHEASQQKKGQVKKVEESASVTAGKITLK